jgi:membrane associated rhomboid family serine protease
LKAQTRAAGDPLPAGVYIIILMILWTFVLQFVWDPQARHLGGWILAKASVEALLGYMWLHNGLAHVVVNLVFVWVVGRVVCRRMAISTFLACYVLTGVAGGLAHLAYDGRTLTGASAAIAGLLGVYSILCFDRMGRLGPWLIVTWFALNAVYAVFFPSGPACAAHCGGFVTGMLTAAVLARSGKATAVQTAPAQTAAASGQAAVV